MAPQSSSVRKPDQRRDFGRLDVDFLPALGREVGQGAGRARRLGDGLREIEVNPVCRACRHDECLLRSFPVAGVQQNDVLSRGERNESAGRRPEGVSVEEDLRRFRGTDLERGQVLVLTGR